MSTKVAIKTGSFISGDLTSGVLTVTHNLGVRAVHVVVEDDTGNRINPDVSYTSTNALTMDFGSMTVSNTWYYRISL